ncbi:cation-translocating P-type ATPase [Cohnella sp. AR92]|uniref:heavy metal translocating P-type ATPase n=1 Tax=Cohnella sp. AR92 TaxID=648716 RepID=UPI000F8EBC3D|nr:cation-translocating P-type ATPase [Cohnella sp. AR92]RUS46881.1 cation-translocating P-type ATPase [Cohnella sp. AR92]
MKNLQLQITGMTCAACSSRIEKALLRVEGVKEATVSLATSSAVVQWENPDLNESQIVDRIHKLGYGAEPLRPRDGDPLQLETRQYRRRFIASAILSVPLLIAMLGHFSDAISRVTPPIFSNPVYQMIAAAVLLLYSGYPFYLGAYHALKQGMPNMDVLIAMSTAVAFFYSQYQALQRLGAHSAHGHPALYFDSIAMILVAVTLGKWMESIAKGNAARSLSSLRQLRSETVRAIRRNAIVTIPVGELAPGERFAVDAPEWIPTDGVIVSGSAEVDESLLTGEGLFVARKAGEKLYAGTRVASGSVVLRSDSNGEETRLSRMIAVVEKAQHAKPAIERRVDRVAAYFVPTILALAVLTFIGWTLHATAIQAMDRAMAVLLVACPCALGLATPISMLIGSSLALRNGIVVKEASTLETLSRANVFMFDKTGTLTRGQPELSDLTSVDIPQSKLLRLAASLEQASDHPFARAIVKEAMARRLLLASPRESKELPGRGIEGIVEGRRLLLGRASWLKERGVELPSSVQEEKGEEPASEQWLAVDGKWAGLLRFRDPIRDDALATVRDLEPYGEIWVASGDRENAARAIASRLGIPNVKAELLPEQKLELLQSLQRKGRRVVMVGDGVNDTAALAAADVGISMAGGNEAAFQAGDVVIAGGRLSRVSDGYRLARLTMRNVKQNLLLAIVYNAVMIPLAVSGILDPRLACLSMASSSLLVVGNSLRLRRIRMGSGESERRL